MHWFRKKYSFVDYGLIIIFCFGIFIALFALGKGALIDYDEALYGKIIQHGISQEVYATLYYNNVPWFEKPPLLFWAIYLSSKLFGVSEFAMRLPSALAGIGCLVLTYLISLAISERKIVALLSVFILVTIPIFWEAARQIRFDVPVTLFILFSCYSLIQGNKNSKWYVGIAVGTGLAILTKSIIGLFIPPLIIIISFVYLNFKWLRSKYFYFGVIGAGFIVVPWHIYQTMLWGKQFWNSYLFHHILQRYSENILGGASSNVIYLENLFIFTGPWFSLYVLLIPILGFLYFTDRNNKALRPIIALFLCSIFILAVFFYGRTKLFYYLIPVYPFIALFLALMCGHVWSFVKTYRLKEIPDVSFVPHFTLIFICIASFAILSSPFIVFHITNNGLTEVQMLANEERGAGQVVSESTQDLPLYAYDFYYWETLRYYSGKDIKMYDSKNPPKGSYFLITPSTPLYAQMPVIRSASKYELLYRGESALLFKVLNTSK